MRFVRCVMIGTLLFALASARADEAVLPTGKRIQGDLKLLSTGRLSFVSEGRSLKLDEVHQVRSSGAPVPPLRLAVAHRIKLRNHQHLTGELVELNAEGLRLRVPWTGRELRVPRADLVGIEQLPGHVTYFDDDFENGLKAWKLTGTPALSDKQRTSGKQSLLLGVAGQAAEYSLPAALEAGQWSINFYDPGPEAGSWSIESEFPGTAGPTVLRVFLTAGKQTYLVEALGAAVTPTRVQREAGWHRLSVEFSSKTLVVSVDEHLLGSSQEMGPGGSLRKVRLSCHSPLEKGGKGGVQAWFDDFGLAKTAPHLRHQLADPAQDEVWQLSGDQLLGSVLRADRRSVEFKAAFGTRTLSWGDIRGLYFQQGNAPVRASDGEHVRVWLRPQSAGEFDRLEAVLTKLDDRQVVLRHPVLGEISVERNCLQQIQWLFHGRRLELNNGRHHLGQKTLADLPPPEGLSVRCAFHLESAPVDTRLVLHVSHLKGPKDGIARELERGGLRTEVLFNGKVIDWLNRQVERSSSLPRRLTLAVPASALRTGKNDLEIRQTVDSESGRCEDCVVSDLVLEFAGKND